MNIIKLFIAKMPVGFQEGLKQIYYKRQIKLEKFITSEPEFKKLDQFVDEGDWVVDIGANIGHYTKKLSELVGEKGRVIAFEPIPSTFVHLSENARHFKHKNITLINAAVSDGTGTVGMTIPNFSTGLKNYYQASVSRDAKKISVSVLTISLDNLKISHKIRLIKIDAEGHEPFVFSGLEQLLKRDKPILIVEMVTDKIRKQLLELGYTEKQYENSPNIVFIVLE